jgi:glutamate carboxypeptidase
MTTPPHARQPAPRPGPSGQLVADAELGGLERAVDQRLPAFLADLEQLVNVDCGSYTTAGVAEIARWTTARLSELGGRVTAIPNDRGLADTLIAELDGTDPSGPTLLCIAHMDTVFDEGTAAERPFTIRDGIATGPGVTDMKAGLLSGLYAIDAIRDVLGGPPLARLIFMANPDEEIGSPVSREHILRIGAGVDACLVLECARANGDIVSSRKGNIGYTIRVHGRAAHAGIEPEKGRSAIVEAARLVHDLDALNGRWPSVTVNVGVIGGGTRSNVVPERCSLEVDLRAIRREELEAADAAIRALTEPRAVPDATIEIADSSRHWPMEKLERSSRLVDLAVGLASCLGIELHDAATGGASDANTTAGIGVPTIDGVGPVGGLDHAPGEYLEVASIAPRTTLLAALIVAIGRDPEIRDWGAARLAGTGSGRRTPGAGGARP